MTDDPKTLPDALLVIRKLDSQRADFRRQLTAEREARMYAEQLADDLRRSNASLRNDHSKFRVMLKSFACGAVVAAALSAALYAHAAELTPKSDLPIVLLKQETYIATLHDCDKVWKERGEKKPRYAIVINQTLCEPKQLCIYRVQAYKRICYRLGNERGKPAQ